jgi:hypothetical protein
MVVLGGAMITHSTFNFLPAGCGLVALEVTNYRRWEFDQAIFMNVWYRSLVQG